MTSKEAVAVRILELCKEKGLAVNALANLAGVTPSTVYSMLNQKSNNPGIVTIQKLCDAIDDGTEKKVTIPDEEQVSQLLQERKYLVLQGAPGTGKTRLAKEMAKKLNAKSFFTQFHAETSYADFVWGIRPKLQGNTLAYESIEGSFSQSLAILIDGFIAEKSAVSISFFTSSKCPLFLYDISHILETLIDHELLQVITGGLFIQIPHQSQAY